MRFRLTLLSCVFVCAALHAGQPNDPGPSMTVEEGAVYRVVDGQDITGRDVLDLLIAENWDKNLQLFVEYALRKEEIEGAKVEVSPSEAEAELQAVLNEYARKQGIPPSEVKLDRLANELGLAGNVKAMRRDVSMNLSLLKIFHREGKLKNVEHVASPAFSSELTKRLQARVVEKGVERDPKKLGAGEAVRIGARGYNRGEVRDFIKDMLDQQPRGIVISKLDVIQLERVIEAELKLRKITITDNDLNFHWSYLCRKIEADTGLPGRETLAAQLETQGWTPETFIQQRVFRIDTAITRMAREGLGASELKAEFAQNPGRYKRNENKIAHIVIRVLDPDGRPYSANWKSGHDAVDAHVARLREQQFAAFKPKIEALMPLAKADFAGTARKHTEDTPEAKAANGEIGRIGPRSVLTPPADNNIRDVALKMKPGEMSEPVRSDYGWHLVKCLDTQDVTYDEAVERVYMNLISERRKKLEEKLSSSAKVENKMKP